jgi:type IV secretion system protein VirB8
MTDPLIFDSYHNYISSNNPRSPANLFGHHSRRIVNILSLSFTGPNSAQVRIRVSVEGAEATRNPTQNYVIWMSYEFGAMSLSTQQRYINPLGFRVTSYTLDEELMIK